METPIFTAEQQTELMALAKAGDPQSPSALQVFRRVVQNMAPERRELLRWVVGL